MRRPADYLSAAIPEQSHSVQKNKIVPAITDRHDLVSEREKSMTMEPFEYCVWRRLLKRLSQAPVVATILFATTDVGSSSCACR